MRFWFLFPITVVLLASCSQSENYNRGYVISHTEVEEAPQREDSVQEDLSTP